MAAVKTYNCRQVFISCGDEAVTGLADDSFVTIEPLGDGVTAITGCDGEVARAVDPNKMYSVKISLLQTSDTNAYFTNRFLMDQEAGNGDFPLTIKDWRGDIVFAAESAWVNKIASLQRGKSTNNREWELTTGHVKISEGTYD